MLVELIPVIEINCYTEKDIVKPKYPYWDNRFEWDRYREESCKKSGFTDKFIPYSFGSNFYRVIHITEKNLVKLIDERFSILNDCIDCNEDDIEPFLGGYVLKLDGEDKLFPQCCGDLSDIWSWNAIIKKDKRNILFEGHPTPKIEIDKDKINLICSNKDEEFDPPTDELITVSLNDLSLAYEKAVEELKVFTQKIKNIESRLKYKPQKNDIENILIYGASE